jgi:hypothetical protein
MSILGADVMSQPITMDYAKVKPMKHHSSTSEKSIAESFTDAGSGMLSPSNGSTRKVGVAQAPIRNWAWTHETKSYDWMDSHGPFSTSDSLD